MTKSEFKKARSLYRYQLSNGGESNLTRAFNIKFVFTLNEVAFCDTGCNYEDSFSWVFGHRGGFKAQSVIYRNVENINFG